jgi:hypothetical protein
MKNLIAGIVIFLIILALGFFVGKSCSKGDNSLPQAYERIEKDITEINNSMKALQDSISALAELRMITKNYYNYEIKKIDSIYASGGNVNLMDSIILHWTDIIFGTRGLFDFPFGSAPTIQSIEDSTTGIKLVPSGRELETGEGLSSNSTW